MFACFGLCDHSRMNRIIRTESHNSMMFRNDDIFVKVNCGVSEKCHEMQTQGGAKCDRNVR